MQGNANRTQFMRGFESLPWHDTPSGSPRRVGVEMEMAGLDAGRIADAVTAELGGKFEADSAFSGRVVETELGEFGVELDASVLTQRTYVDTLKRLGIDIEPGELRDNLESVLSRLAGLVVPHELVCPPVALDRLADIDRIRARLHDAGAKGTQSSALYAFGLQFNVEVHDDGAEALLNVLRAFFLCFDGIVEREDIDFSRKLTPFVQPYPEDYVAHVLDPDYQPDRTTLIDDFLEYTPTRNRPLDLLPLFAWLDKDRVMAAPVERDLVKPRPTWHYRLPNCRIDDPEWSLHAPWAEWAAIERLAADPEQLMDKARERFGRSSALRRWAATAWRRLRYGDRDRGE